MTPINYLASQIDDDNFERIYLFHMKRLIEHLANINIPDDGGITPIWRIIKNEKLSDANKRIILRHLLEDTVDIDIDSYQNGDIREKLEQKFPDLSLPPVHSRRNEENWDFTKLVQCLSNKKETEFLKGLNCIVEFHENDLPEFFRMNGGKGTLLIMAVENGMLNAVKRLLRLGAEVNFKGKGISTPIECACRCGYWRILEIFLRSAKIDTCTNEPLIWIVLPFMVSDGEESDGDEEIDYEKCFETLMWSSKIDIDYVNSSNQTALDTAIRLNGRPDIITALLNKGAYIGVHSKSTHQAYSKYSLSKIDPKLLEQRFDNCIIPFYREYEDEYFEIRFDFRNLASISYKQNKGLSDAFANEMEPINCIAESKELRHLLKHPLIQSFLYLKWQRLALIFNINLYLYFVFGISVLSYIITSYIFSPKTNIAWWVSVFMTFVMILRELFQFILSPHSYWKSMQNYVEIGLLAMVVFMLSDFSVSESRYTDFYIGNRTVATITILFVTSELFILLGTMEMFFIHFTMLKSVLISFVKAFMLYAIFFVAFALCFFTLLNEYSAKEAAYLRDQYLKGNMSPIDFIKTYYDSTGRIVHEKLDHFSSFRDLPRSLIKIIVMSTGEFDAGNINFDFNPLSYLLFLVFLFLVSTVLFNLLNGLAVTDIQVCSE